MHTYVASQVKVGEGGASWLVSGKAMIQCCETALGIWGKCNQGLEGKQYKRWKVASESAVEIRRFGLD